MAANKILNIPPVAIGTSVANVLNTGGAGTGVGYTATAPYIILKHMRILNKTASAVTFNMWKGATGASAAGTEVAWNAYSVAANSYIDWYGQMRLDSADFLTASASAATSLTLQMEGEIGLS